MATNTIEKFIEFIWERQYLTRDQKKALEADIRYKNNLECEREPIKNLAELLQKIEKRLEIVEEIIKKGGKKNEKSFMV